MRTLLKQRKHFVKTMAKALIICILRIKKAKFKSYTNRSGSVCRPISRICSSLHQLVDLNHMPRPHQAPQRRRLWITFPPNHITRDLSTIWYDIWYLNICIAHHVVILNNYTYKYYCEISQIISPKTTWQESARNCLPNIYSFLLH